MANTITGIDHVLIAVRDLDAAARAFARLGFAVGPRGGHPEWGTASRGVMFGVGSVKLITPVGEGLGAARVGGFLSSRGEGILGVALGSTDAKAGCAALRRAGIAAEPPALVSRRIEAPEGVLTRRYAVVNLPEDTLPGLSAVLCQKVTPGPSPCPDAEAHPNGAVGIASLTAVVERPLACMAAYDRVFGAAAATPTDEMVSVHVGGRLIYLITADGFDHLHPDLLGDLPEPPAPAALSLAVADLGRAAAVLTANGIGFRRKSGLIAIDPDDALGIGLELVAE